MNAILISTDLAELAAESLITSGQLHSVFDHAVNCTYGESGWLTLLTEEPAIGPMSLVLKASSLKSKELLPGMRMEIGRGRLSIPEVDLTVLLKGISAWSPYGEPIMDPVGLDVKKERLESFEKWIRKNGNMHGIANVLDYLELPDRSRKLRPETELNAFGQFALERIQAFTDALAEIDVQRIGDRARGIIGFGPGLTPSGDDFLAGVGASLIYLKSYYGIKNQDFLLPVQLIGEEAIGRTTRVSEEMLKNLSSGRMSRRFINLQEALLSQKGPELRPVLQELDRMGETSGTDHALGVFAAHCVLASEKVRRNIG